jgi:uncharacterized membrane protein
MTSLTTIELKNIHPEDVGDVLKKIEKSFGFKFRDTELKDVKSFGELCDIITCNVQGDSTIDCTTQQAFYKLKAAILVTTAFPEKGITVDTDLNHLFPRKLRRRQVNSLEKELGFQTNLLHPKHWVPLSLTFVFFVSLIGIYFSWQAGLLGIVLSLFAMMLAFKFGKELDLTTVGELAEKISREHYKKIRRNPSSVNRIEIVQKVKEIFMKDLDLKNALTREAIFW